MGQRAVGVTRLFNHISSLHQTGPRAQFNSPLPRLSSPFFRSRIDPTRHINKIAQKPRNR